MLGKNVKIYRHPYHAHALVFQIFLFLAGSLHLKIVPVIADFPDDWGTHVRLGTAQEFYELTKRFFGLYPFPHLKCGTDQKPPPLPRVLNFQVICLM